MNQTPLHSQGKAGFALIVVLATLAILTFLFAVSSQRTLSVLKTQTLEANILDTLQRNKALLELSAKWKSLPENKDEYQFLVTGSDELWNLELIDVGTLVDLNTADMKLANLFIEFIGGGQAEQKNYLEWRRKGVRMQRVSELPHILGPGFSPKDKLEQYATIYSGRKGIDTEEVKNDFLTYLKERLAQDELQILNTESHGSNYLVIRTDILKSKVMSIGVISIGSSGSRILKQH